MMDKEKIKGISIKNRYTQEVIYTSKKKTIKEAVEEAAKSGVLLVGAVLRGEIGRAHV